MFVHRLVPLAVLLALSISGAEAAPPCNLTTLTTTPSPAAAAKLLQQSMGQGVTLGAGSPRDILSAVHQSFKRESYMLSEVTSLVAVARPDLMDDLSSLVKDLCPDAASTIVNRYEQASAEPSADDLAALAETEGSAPAAGTAQEPPSVTPIKSPMMRALMQGSAN